MAELHSIIRRGDKPIPKDAKLIAHLGVSPNTMRISLKLPNQKNFRDLGEVPIKDGVVELDIRLLFLCHAKEDAQQVASISKRLEEDGFLTWFDRKDLQAGAIWRTRIKQAIESANFVLIFLSKASCSKTGFVQRK